jgi:hypothetical protein
MTPVNRQTIFLTSCGTLTALCDMLLVKDLLRTCLLAATGTVISFMITVLLKKVFGKK